MYGEDEWKMSGYKTTYSTDEKQLYIPRKFSNLSEPYLRSWSQNISYFLGMYISDVNSYYIFRKTLSKKIDNRAMAEKLGHINGFWSHPLNFLRHHYFIYLLFYF